MRKRKYTLILAPFVIVLAFVLPVRALDLGLTPSHVFSLWTNINQAILTIADLKLRDGALNEKIRAMNPAAFFGKTPGNVLALGLEVESMIDTLRVGSDLPPTGQFIVSDETTTPSDVFLVSSRILGSSVEWIIRNTEPDHLVSKYFAEHEFADKTPSNVFGLVDLAHRRMELIVGRNAAGSLATQAPAR
jgi:hypothetical protein